VLVQIVTCKLLLPLVWARSVMIRRSLLCASARRTIGNYDRPRLTYILKNQKRRAGKHRISILSMCTKTNADCCLFQSEQIVSSESSKHDGLDYSTVYTSSLTWREPRQTPTQQRRRTCSMQWRWRRLMSRKRIGRGKSSVGFPSLAL